MSEKDEVIDQIVRDRHEQAVQHVAKEFKKTPDEIRRMLADNEGTYEERREYNRYFEILDEYVKGAEHS